jgi:hypothetical protein
VRPPEPTLIWMLAAVAVAAKARRLRMSMFAVVRANLVVQDAEQISSGSFPWPWPASSRCIYKGSHSDERAHFPNSMSVFGDPSSRHRHLPLKIVQDVIIQRHKTMLVYDLYLSRGAWRAASWRSYQSNHACYMATRGGNLRLELYRTQPIKFPELARGWLSSTRL